MTINAETAEHAEAKALCEFREFRVLREVLRCRV